MWVPGLRVAFRGGGPAGPTQPGLRVPSPEMRVGPGRVQAMGAGGARTADRWCLLQMHSIRNLPSTQLREQQQEDGVEDMTQLE